MENRDVEAMRGEMFPKYQVKPMCAHPDCSRFVDHVHHIVRRSFIIGDVAWVRYANGDIVGNLVGLCAAHHEDLTINKAFIRYDERDQHYWWFNALAENTGQLYPHPPRHFHAHEHDPIEVPLIGPGTLMICPGCKRPVPRKREPGEKLDAKRRRKSWTVQVPDDADEDGAVVLDTMVEALASLFGKEDSPNLRYFTLIEAMALVLQNSHLMGESSKLR